MGKRGNGEGSIVKRSDGRWQGSVCVGRDDRGKLIRKYFYGKTRKSVSDKMAEAIKAINQNSYIMGKDNPTAKAWFHTWLWKYKRNSIKDTTFDQYESVLRIQVIPRIGDIKLLDLTTDIIQNMINDMYASGISRRTAEITKVILHGAFKQAVRNKLMYENIAENVVLPKKDGKEIRVLDKNEQTQLIDALMGDYIGRALLFGLFTGLRRGEILALTWEDFNEKDKTVSVSKTLSRVNTYSDKGNKTKLVVTSPKTEKSRRIIPLIDKAYNLLLKHKQHQDIHKRILGELYNDENIIFASDMGSYIDPGNLNRKLYKTASELGMEHFGPHTLRHSFATRGLEADMSLKAMQEILGHSSISITGDIYTHVLMEQKKKEVAKLNSVF